MNSTNADEPPELHEHLGNSVEARLIDPRVHAAPLAVRPPLAVEESGGPGEVMTLQPRDLDRTGRACLPKSRGWRVMTSPGTPDSSTDRKSTPPNPSPANT